MMMSGACGCNVWSVANDPPGLTNLIKSVESGYDLDLSDKVGADKVIQADWIRLILIGRRKPDSTEGGNSKIFDPRGIGIRGALIEDEDELNLDYANATDNSAKLPQPMPRYR